MKQRIDFLELYEKINQVLPTADFQKLMDVCYEVTRIPIIIVDVMYNVLGVAPQEKTGDYLWDHLVEFGHFETDKVAQMYEENIIQSVESYETPYVIDWASQKEHPKVQGVVRIKGDVLAYVSMNCKPGEIDEDKLKAMEIIENVCTCLMKIQQESENPLSAYQNAFMVELLYDRIKTKKQLEKWQEIMNFPLHPPYRILEIATEKEDGHLLLPFLQRKCQTLFPHQLMALQQKNLILLVYEKDWLEREYLRKELEGVLKQFHAYAGISECFTDLSEFPLYKQQALAAQQVYRRVYKKAQKKEQKQERLGFYSALRLQAILLPIKEKMEEQNYIPSVFREMAAYDEENHTEFLQTLRTYIYQMKSTSETAEELHIHRNTLLYRIRKMEEIFHFSLKEKDTVLYFMMIFYLIDLE